MHAAGVRGYRPAGLGQRDKLRGTLRPGAVRYSRRQLIARHVSRDTVIRVLDAHFATSTEQFRAENEKAAGARRSATINCAGSPITRCAAVPCSPGSGPATCARCRSWPGPRPHRGACTSLAWATSGRVRERPGEPVQQYVGRQLRLLPGAQVLPEITYGPKSARRKTVDWIVVLPEVVLLVEVKSAIPTEPVRLGTPDAADAIVSKLGKAVDQIDITAQLINDRDPALAEVPADRPVLGLAVTLEPFHIANAFGLLPAGRTPVTVATPPRSRRWSRSPTCRRAGSCWSAPPTTVRFTWSLDTALTGTNAAGTRSWTRPGIPTRGCPPPAPTADLHASTSGNTTQASALCAAPPPVPADSAVPGSVWHPQPGERGKTSTTCPRQVGRAVP